MNTKISFIQCGGTIDKGYPQGLTDHGYAFKIEEPATISILERAKPQIEIDMHEVLRKDSLDMDQTDRDTIKEYVENIENDKIILTHGTDTMSLTAEDISSIKGKTIVLTGSMLPERFRNTDADFNLGMAIGGVQVLPHGTYIALQGRLVKWDEF